MLSMAWHAWRMVHPPELELGNHHHAEPVRRPLRPLNACRPLIDLAAEAGVVHLRSSKRNKDSSCNTRQPQSSRHSVTLTYRK